MQASVRAALSWAHGQPGAALGGVLEAQAESGAGAGEADEDLVTAVGEIVQAGAEVPGRSQLEGGAGADQLMARDRVAVGDGDLGIEVERDALGVEAEAEAGGGVEIDVGAADPAGAVEQGAVAGGEVGDLLAGGVEGGAQAGGGAPGKGQLGAAGFDGGAVDVQELLEVEVDEVAEVVIEEGGVDVQVGGGKAVGDAGVAAGADLGAEAGVAAERAGAGEGEEARQLEGAAARGVQAGVAAAELPGEAEAGVELDAVAAGARTGHAVQAAADLDGHGALLEEGLGEGAEEVAGDAVVAVDVALEGDGEQEAPVVALLLAEVEAAAPLEVLAGVEGAAAAGAQLGEGGVLGRGRHLVEDGRARAVQVVTVERGAPAARVVAAVEVQLGEHALLAVVGAAQLAVAVERPSRGVGVVVGVPLGVAADEAHLGLVGHRLAGVAVEVELAKGVEGDAVALLLPAAAQEVGAGAEVARYRAVGLAQRGVAAVGRELAGGRAAPPLAGDDVDDTGEAGRAEEGREGAAHHLDALDLVGGHPLQVEEDRKSVV